MLVFFNQTNVRNFHEFVMKIDKILTQFFPDFHIKNSCSFWRNFIVRTNNSINLLHIPKQKIFFNNLFPEQHYSPNMEIGKVLFQHISNVIIEQILKQSFIDSKIGKVLKQSFSDSVDILKSFFQFQNRQYIVSIFYRFFNIRKVLKPFFPIPNLARHRINILHIPKSEKD